MPVAQSSQASALFPVFFFQCDYGSNADNSHKSILKYETIVFQDARFQMELHRVLIQLSNVSVVFEKRTILSNISWDLGPAKLGCNRIERSWKDNLSQPHKGRHLADPWIWNAALLH